MVSPETPNGVMKTLTLIPFWQCLRTQKWTPKKVSIETFYFLIVLFVDLSLWKWDALL